MTPYICCGLILFDNSLIEDVKSFYNLKHIEDMHLCITAEEEIQYVEYKENHLEFHFRDKDGHVTHYIFPDNVSVYLKEINTLYTFKEHDMRHALLVKHPIDANIVFKEEYKNE